MFHQKYVKQAIKGIHFIYQFFFAKPESSERTNLIKFNQSEIFYATQIVVLFALLLLIPIFLIFSRYQSLVIIAIITPLFGFSIKLSQRGKVKSSGILTIGLLLTFAFILCIRGEGLHDMAIFIFPLIIVIAGLVLNRYILIATVVLINLLIFLIAYFESIGFTNSYLYIKEYPNIWGDFVVSIVIMMASGLFVNVIMRSILKSFKTLQKQEESLLEKNLELENYKGQLEQLVDERTDEIFQLNRELVVTNEELYTANDALIIQRDDLEIAFTKLKQTQNRLVHSEKMASLGVLVAGIAHEINNPINFINSGVLGLKENLIDLFTLLNQYREINYENVESKLLEIKTTEETLEYNELISITQCLINNIETGIERTASIIKGLHTFGRSDEKELNFFNVHNSIDINLLMLYSKYKNRIIIKKDYGTIPEIEGYSGQINQVLMNILSNGMDSIQGNGTITIKTQIIENQQKIKISIQDTGSGIEDSIVSKIFDPFYTTKPTGEGVGLGLAISYSIIKEHNGEIEVNGNYGKGAEFIITLPIKQ